MIPGLEFNVVDNSALQSPGGERYALVEGPTEKGEIAKPTPVINWRDFQRKLGGLMNSETLFPLLCKRALDGGTKLVVSRSGHYSDPADPTTLEGTKSYLYIKGGSTTTVSVSAADDTADTFTVASELAEFFPQGMEFTITGSSGNNGTYTVITATESGGSTTIEVEESVPSSTADGDIEYEQEFVEFRGRGIGPGYDGDEIEVLAPASGQSNVVDIAITVPGFPALSRTHRDVPESPTQTELDQFNAGSSEIRIASFQGLIPQGNGTLNGGEYDVSAIVAADRIGDSNAETGFHSWNKTSLGVRAAMPDLAEPDVDVALAAYCQNRQIKHFMRGPLGVVASEHVDYRNGDGSYSHTAIDDYRSEMWVGGLIISNADTGNVETEIPELGDALGKAALRDRNAFPWFSFSGSKRGRVEDALGVVRNFGNPALSNQWTNLTDNGINAVIDHESFGPVFYGNRSLYKDTSSWLAASNVGDLILELRRMLRPEIEEENFDPNDPDLWKQIYNKAKQVLDFVSENRGINGGENVGWVWKGDQNADTPDEATVNTADSIQQGKFLAQLYIKPIRAVEFMQIDITLTAQSFDFSVIS